MNNHYIWLDKNLPIFLDRLGVQEYAPGLIRAHGDKCYSYKEIWKKGGLHFYHGVAIYLLTYCRPFYKEVRETELGWISPQDWVLGNKDRFISLLPPI
jgi:hypothetical protein